MQTPRDKLPRLFKTIQVNYEILDIDQYKAQFFHLDPNVFKANIINDLEHRLKTKTP